MSKISKKCGFFQKRRVVLWIHVVTTIEKKFSPIEHISDKNASLQQHWHSKTLSASTVASLRAVGAGTTFRSMCFSQVHSHLPDREDVNVLDCITFCDQFFRQNLLNCQTYAPIRKIYVTLHVYAAFVSDSGQGNKKNCSKMSSRSFWISVENYWKCHKSTPSKDRATSFSAFFSSFHGLSTYIHLLI